MREFEKSKKTTSVSGFVFHRKGQPIADIRVSWRAACKPAEVEGNLFHGLRRTFARNAIRAGVPERVAMAITGHKTRSMFDRYNIVSEDDLRKAVKQTQDYLSAAPQGGEGTGTVETESNPEEGQVRVS